MNSLFSSPAQQEIGLGQSTFLHGAGQLAQRHRTRPAAVLPRELHPFADFPEGQERVGGGLR